MGSQARRIGLALGTLGVACAALVAPARGNDIFVADPAGAVPPEIAGAVPPAIAEEQGGGPPAEPAAAADATPAPVEPVPAAEPTAAPVDTSTPLERAWRGAGPEFDRLVFEVRRHALEVGAWNFAPAARALAAQGGADSRLDRARAAVALAPDLPAAHMELASALWLDAEDPLAAVRQVFAAGAAAVRHAEASFWFAGSALYLLAVALIAGGLLAMFLAGISALPHVSHDLGHLLPGSLPEFSRFALLAAALLSTLLFGEGLLGLALALGAVALIAGGRSHKIGMAIAALGIGVGVYPLGQAAGAVLEALPLDPVARAAFSVGEGLATPVDLARLEAAAADDALAARALAIHARRHGRLAVADAHYQDLLERGQRDIATLNNAANVRLDLGHIERALEHYSEALELGEEPVVLFNLAQAHGRGFQVEDLNRTFARAQSVGGDLVAKLTALQGTEVEGFVVDYPLPSRLFWARVWERKTGEAVAAELRARVAPGWLGRDPRHLGGGVLAMLVLGGVLAAAFEASRWCARCGARVCLRCDPQNAAGRTCEGCRRLFQQPEKTERLLRLQRVQQLQRREKRLGRLVAAVSVVVPGAAGLLSGSALRCWLGAVCFALGVAAWLWRDGLLPDPLIAGAAAPFAFLGLAGLAALGYAAVVATSLAARRNA